MEAVVEGIKKIILWMKASRFMNETFLISIAVFLIKMYLSVYLLV
jgi:hypothetical protein